jgi:hypothetical protein
MGDLFDFQTLWVLQPGKLLADRARYEIFNAERQLLATATQTKGRGRLSLPGKPMPDSTVLDVVTAAGEPVLSLIKQNSEWLTELRDPAGELIGRIRMGRTRRHYSLADDQDQAIGEVIGDLALKKFAVTDSGGGKFAQVRKTRAGLIKEMLTSSDHYKVDFTGPVAQPVRTLAVMTAIVLDLTLYEPT